MADSLFVPIFRPMETYMGRPVGVECLAECADYRIPFSSNDMHRQKKGLLSSRNGFEKSRCGPCL
jgi:hypothetical protein